ncbi:MAG: FAD-dependent oxidoreductase, partial [Hydrogenovibrio sp.]
MTEPLKTEKAPTSTDVVIVGGGMVGATVALGLAQAGFDVTLLERQAPSLEWSDDAPYQTRVSALTRASENILKHLNAWAGIERRRGHAFTDMHVWESISEAAVHFDAREIQEPNLGYVVENNVIQAALWEQMPNYPNLHCIVGQSIQDLKLDNDQAWVELDKGDCLQARLVVGADGALSKTRDLAGIAIQTHDYQQCAVVGCVKTELS